MKFRLKPNKFSEVHAKTVVSDLPKHSPITVFIRWCSHEKCDISFVSAQIKDTNYLVREEYYTITVPVPEDGEPASAVTITLTETVTATVPMTTTTITSTQTVTTTRTATITQAITTTTTATITKPAWPIQWSSCYGIDNYIYVYGDLNRKVDKDAEIVPYVVKVYDCTVFGRKLLGIVPFEWPSTRSIQAKYGPVYVKPLHSIKIEIWSIDINTGTYKDKTYEETVDTSVRCA